MEYGLKTSCISAIFPSLLITEQYLDHLKLMKVLNLDIAGEYLLMAATLLQYQVEDAPPCFFRRRRARKRRRIRGQNWSKTSGVSDV